MDTGTTGMKTRKRGRKKESSAETSRSRITQAPKGESKTNSEWNKSNKKREKQKGGNQREPLILSVKSFILSHPLSFRTASRLRERGKKQIENNASTNKREMKPIQNGRTADLVCPHIP